MSAISISVTTRKTESWYHYLIVMLESLRQNSGLDCPIYLNWDHCLKEQLKDFCKVHPNLVLRRVDYELYLRHNKGSLGWSCLEHFNPPEPTHGPVLGIDADFICTGDLNELMNWPCELGMVKEPDSGIYNGGLTLLSGKHLTGDTYEKLMLCDHTKIKLGGNRDNFSKDQKLYNYFFGKELTELPATYNGLVSRTESIDATLIHYIYKPIYPIGRKQLKEINPDFITIWDHYHDQALARISR